MSEVIDEPETSIVVRLSDQQLAAYNSADLHAFCECYSEDIRVIDGDGNETISGMESFRERYGKLFNEFEGIEARILSRLSMGSTVVEHEQWKRRNRQTLEWESGEVIVRYSAENGKIAVAQFIR